MTPVDCDAVDSASIGLSPHHKQGISMCMAPGLLSALSATILLVSMSGAQADEQGDTIADHLGQVNAWRLIPPTLLERCAKELPERDAERRATFENWNRANEKLIASIERAVERAASQRSGAASSPVREEVDRINAATVQLIHENYFQDRSVTLAQVCDDYGRIVARLSGAGTVATTRGRLYSLEALLAARRPSTATKPNPSF